MSDTTKAGDLMFGLDGCNEDDWTRLGVRLKEADPATVAYDNAQVRVHTLSDGSTVVETTMGFDEGLGCPCHGTVGGGHMPDCDTHAMQVVVGDLRSAMGRVRREAFKQGEAWAWQETGLREEEFGYGSNLYGAWTLIKEALEELDGGDANE